MLDVTRQVAVGEDGTPPKEPQAAVAYWRALARERPGRFDRELASSLVTYAHAQSMGGDTVGAVATGQEALTLWRSLDEASGAFEPQLGTIMYALSVYLSKLGNAELAR